MRVLLDQDEIAFLDATKEEIGKYSSNEFIMKMLTICTKNKMKRQNFVSDFNKFSLCIRKKILRLAGSDEYGLGDSFTSQNEKTMKIPEFIEPTLITKAIVKGYPQLKSIIERMAKENKMNLDKHDDLKELAFICTLIIIARANIEFRFTN